MKKVAIVLGGYTLLLSMVIGVVAALFLAAVHFSTDFIWEQLPESLNQPNFYPLMVGLIGALLVGLMQTRWGAFPYTMHENMSEFRDTGRIEYKKRLGKTIVAAWIILSFGASVGPEAALIGIVGAMITWLVEHLRINLASREELVNLGIGAMMSVIFLAPFNGIVQDVEHKNPVERKLPGWLRYSLSIVASFCALAAFVIVKQLLPLPESIFAIRLSDQAIWNLQNLIFVVPAMICGVAFAFYFNGLQSLVEKGLHFVRNKWLLALIGGLSIGLLGMISSYFLFSGEHQLIEMSSEVAKYSWPFLLLLALLKPLLAAICVNTGWKGGLIFPAIFASSVMGYVFTWPLNGHIGFLLTIFVAASCSRIVGSPLLTSSILLFVFPLQLFPFILLTSLIVNPKRVRELLHKEAKS